MVSVLIQIEKNKLNITYSSGATVKESTAGLSLAV
jgi:hypothetical protein